MPEPRLTLSVCADFAPEVRAALPAHLRDRVEVVELEADCIGAQRRCRERCEELHAAQATHTELTIGDMPVDVAHGADRAGVCALQCSGPSGYPLINRAFAEQLVADGAYLLTPGWARNWQSYLRAQGFDRALGRQYFHEFASQLVLLDTGTDPRAAQRLVEMGAYLDLPTQCLPCGLDHLRLFLTGLVLEWELDAYRVAHHKAEQRASAQQADYAVTLDLLGALAGVTDEGEVAERVLDLVTLLFAPGRLHLLTIADGQPGALHSRPPAAEAEAAAICTRLAALEADYTHSADGFDLLVGRGDTRAALEIGAFALPERCDDYLNLAVTLSGAFDLALANARSFGRLDRVRQELRASEERYRVLMEQASDAIVLMDVRGVVTEANALALRLMGKTRGQVVGRRVYELHDVGIAQAVAAGFEGLLRDGAATISGIRHPRPGVDDMVIDATFAVIDVAGRRIVQGMFRDVSERERTARELEALSLTDALTGLRNRRGFMTLAEQQMKTAARLGRPLLLLFADIDDLKPVNDLQGHAAGDRLLRTAAGVLVRSFRDMDIVARMGGDEFAVLQMDAGADDAPAAAERLAAAVTAANEPLGRAQALSLSVGAAAFDPAVPCTLDELLQVADRRMYAAKRRRAALTDDAEPGTGGGPPGQVQAQGAGPEGSAAPTR